MLVLSRKKNESVVIGGNITVTVVEIRDGKVRLGIVAPKDVPVHREEVQEAIEAEEATSDRDQQSAGGASGVRRKPR
jgi:carbon storage regulator